MIEPLEEDLYDAIRRCALIHDIDVCVLVYYDLNNRTTVLDTVKQLEGVLFASAVPSGNPDRENEECMFDRFQKIKTKGFRRDSIMC
jgi:hypothetical protein